MIEYKSGTFGFQLLSLRLDGSAVFKSLAPSILSSIVYIFLFMNYSDLHFNVDTSINEPILIHPYPMGALIAALTFLLTFRANFSYNRYWEAVTAVHTMHSRWLDASTQATAFHLQSPIYDSMKPPTFTLYDQPIISTTTTITTKDSTGNNTTTVTNSNFNKRSRERTNEPTLEELEIMIDDIEQKQREADAAAAAATPTSAISESVATTTTHTARGTVLRENSIRRSRMSIIFGAIWQRMSSTKQPSTETGTDLNNIASHQSAGGVLVVGNDKSNVTPPPPPMVNQSTASSNKTSTGIAKDGVTNHSINAEMEPTHSPIKHKHSFLRAFSLGHDDDDESSSSYDDKQDNDVDNSQNHQNHHQHHHHHSEKHKPQHFVSSSIPKQSLVSPETTYEIWKNVSTPLYLQELAHLFSLLSAVALSGLRNDIAGCESPLAVFTPGAPWPYVDPDSYSASVRQGWSGTKHRYWELIKYLVNISRTPEARTLYNAARPFRVIGGISDNEVLYLQAAKNPSAKVALVMMWVVEFLSRESRYGATGTIAPPILTRMYQLLSDGMSSYNQARKVAYVPFPFPHAQITALYTLLVTGFMPVLMLQFVTNVWVGFMLNFLTVMCFTGLQEVARELESPFLNEPNDIPLNNYQAQYNESLLVMFAGYHPDFYIPPSSSSS